MWKRGCLGSQEKRRTTREERTLAVQEGRGGMGGGKGGKRPYAANREESRGGGGLEGNSILRSRKNIQREIVVNGRERGAKQSKKRTKGRGFQKSIRGRLLRPRGMKLELGEGGTGRQLGKEGPLGHTIGGKKRGVRKEFSYLSEKAPRKVTNRLSAPSTRRHYKVIQRSHKEKLSEMKRT